MFPVRYGLNSYMNLLRNSVFKGLIKLMLAPLLLLSNMQGFVYLSKAKWPLWLINRYISCLTGHHFANHKPWWVKVTAANGREALHLRGKYAFSSPAFRRTFLLQEFHFCNVPSPFPPPNSTIR
jgi:hypothetical protein